MVHPCPCIVGDLLRQTLALVRTHPVVVRMTIHEAFQGPVILCIIGLCTKALQQAHSLEQHKNLVGNDACLAHLKGVEQQLVLDG